MRRLRALIWNLPAESATARRLAARPAEQPTTVDAPAASKKVDYDALRALGGEVITIDRERTG